MKDFTNARLSSQPMNLWPCEIFKIFSNTIKYLESAHGQLTSFIRPIADMGVDNFHYILWPQWWLKALKGLGG